MWSQTHWPTRWFDTEKQLKPYAMGINEGLKGFYGENFAFYCIDDPKNILHLIGN